MSLYFRRSGISCICLHLQREASADDGSRGSSEAASPLDDSACRAASVGSWWRRMFDVADLPAVVALLTPVAAPPPPRPPINGSGSRTRPQSGYCLYGRPTSVWRGCRRWTRSNREAVSSRAATFSHVPAGIKVATLARARASVVHACGERESRFALGCASVRECHPRNARRRAGVRPADDATLGGDHCRWPRGADRLDRAVGLVCGRSHRSLRGVDRYYEVPVLRQQPL